MNVTLPVKLPVHEPPRLRLLRRRGPVIPLPDPDDSVALLRFGDGAIVALAGDQAAYDLGINSVGDRVIADLPIRTEMSPTDMLLVRTSAGSRKVSFGDLINILET
ncbi:hypothetical protein HJA82_29695 [Rhizobium bangladeshense]|uniref:hypothetical protein n=1 Tax=Rhizobium bangladeshense TaxID=1138189 RepID=UPI001C834525|nr:hypothetical protein [Rhizobium bangladeshense]MBX4911491.1 hypothetical protein [Rhizobium bangladeshense]